MRNTNKFWSENGRNRSDYLGVDVRILLKLILQNRVWAVDWIYLAQYRDHWRALSNFGFRKRRGTSWLAVLLLVFSRRILLYGVRLVILLGYCVGGWDNICPLYGTTAHVRLCLPLYRGFLITHNYTHGTTPLDEWSALRRGLYLHRTTQHVNTRDKRPCPQLDLNPRSQQPNGRRPTP
jgi:hypothetical protein